MNTVLLVEDDALLRREFCRAFGQLGRVVREASCGGDAVACAKQLSDDAVPFTVLLDLGLPDRSGIDVIFDIGALPACRPPIVVCSVFEDPSNVLAALRAGARGYVSKSASTPAIIDAIVAAERGEVSLSPSVARHVVDVVAPSHTAEAVLTARELVVLNLLGQGASYAECSATMQIGVGTVQTYVKSIYRKLDVSSKVSAVNAARRLGLLSRQTRDPW